MKAIGVIAALLGLAVAGALGFAYSGIFDVAATTRDAPLVRWILETTRESSVRRRAEQISLPEPSGAARLAQGAKAFDEMCAGCHGAPGRKPFLGAGDMNPPPPDLAKLAPERTPQELFWVIKHGLRMTGMPAWGPSHDDLQLWDLVAFVERLPELAPDGYQALAKAEVSDGHGHAHGAVAGSDEDPANMDGSVKRDADPAGNTGGAQGEHGSHAH